jgi:hypothetical protein
MRGSRQPEALTVLEGAEEMPKAQCLVFVLCLVLSSISSPVAAQSPKEQGAIVTLPMSYQDLLKAFAKIKKGMGQEEVRNLLGAPDRISGEDPDQTWFDEEWMYDFRNLAGYPKADSLRAVWEGTVMFLKRKVVHTRKIGWLE